MFRKILLERSGVYKYSDDSSQHLHPWKLRTVAIGCVADALEKRNGGRWVPMEQKKAGKISFTGNLTGPKKTSFYFSSLAILLARYFPA